MVTYNLRRFTHAEGLKGIARKHLLALLKPHKSYFVSRGLTLPPPSASDGLDYVQLVNVLMNPNADTPKTLTVLEKSLDDWYERKKRDRV